MNAEDVITVLDNSGGLSRQDTKVEAVDHAVLLCDDMQAFQEVVPRLAENAIVNAFAGLKGKQVTVPLRDICARGVRVIGHSGVTFDVHRQTLQEVLDGGVNLAPVVAAVGGFHAAWDGLRAADDRSVPGKTVIYQDIDLPITPVEQLTGPEPWSAEAERKLLAEHGVSIRGIV